MYKQQIIENNKLLAEFMYWGKNTVNGLGEFAGRDYFLPEGLYNITEISDISTECTNRTTFLKAKDLKFHTDWNWLMLVIKKISNIMCEYELDSEEYDAFNDIFPENIILEEFFDADIESIYERVVNFVQWFNNNK